MNSEGQQQESEESSFRAEENRTATEEQERVEESSLQRESRSKSEAAT